jgi:hypothetical protein
MVEKISPNVQRLITPIMSRMTSIYLAEQQNPIIGAQNRGDQYKREKQECVHFIFNGNTPECKLIKTDDGRLKCSACGREIYAKFDGSNVNALLEARKVVEQIMWFGMINRLNPDVVAACIDMKKMLPDLAQIAAELNEYVKREENNIDTVQNIGAEYRFNGFTSVY